MKTIACITCYDGDVHLLNRCLDSIVDQRVKPEILVVCSSKSSETKQSVNQDLLEFSKKNPNHFDNIYHFHKDYTTRAAGARNMLYEYSKRVDLWLDGPPITMADSDVVVFCDVDDFIHPSKFEVVNQVFSECDHVDALIHNYHSIPRNAKPDPSMWKSDPVNLQWDDERKVWQAEASLYHGRKYYVSLVTDYEEGSYSNVQSPSGSPVSHGHIACRVSVLSELQWDEDKAGIGEDGFFCRSIVDHPKFNLYCTDLKLIAYLS
jgi:glycosyltransferase involved in cell wall biosynthesis